MTLGHDRLRGLRVGAGWLGGFFVMLLTEDVVLQRLNRRGFGIDEGDACRFAVGPHDSGPQMEFYRAAVARHAAAHVNDIATGRDQLPFTGCGRAVCEVQAADAEITDLADARPLARQYDTRR